MTIRSSKMMGYLYVAVAAVIWGSNGVVVKWVPVSPYVVAFFRVFFASLSLLPVLLLTQRREMVEAGKAWRSLLVLGALLSLGWGFLFQSMRLIAIASAVLLNYMAPVFVALLAPLFLKERIEKVTILALVISMVGMTMISYHPNSPPGSLNLFGVVYGLAAGLAYAGFIILSKRTVGEFSSQAVGAYAYSATVIFLSPSLIGANMSMDLASWALLAVLGVCNTGFAVTLYLNGLGLVKAQEAVVFTYLEPIISVVFGYVFLAQQPTLGTLIGGFLILLAGYVVVSR